MLKSYSFANSNSPLKMFIIPMENMAPIKRDFGNENHAGFRMPFTVNIKIKRLTTVKGGAEYLLIFPQVLKKFSLSAMALISGLSYCLRMKKGALTTISFFFFGTLLTRELLN